MIFCNASLLSALVFKWDAPLRLDHPRDVSPPAASVVRRLPLGAVDKDKQQDDREQDEYPAAPSLAVHTIHSITSVFHTSVIRQSQISAGHLISFIQNVIPLGVISKKRELLGTYKQNEMHLCSLHG